MPDIGVRELLVEIRREADVIGGDDRLSAYGLAVNRVIMRTAEALEMTPFEARILDVLDTLSPKDIARPVATKRLATELGIDYFALHYHMRKLESRGLVRRPQGQRSGWKVA